MATAEPSHEYSLPAKVLGGGGGVGLVIAAALMLAGLGTTGLYLTYASFALVVGSWVVEARRSTDGPAAS